MTRKDYELVAGVLREAVQDPNSDIETTTEIAMRLVHAFMADNPRFSASSFVKAIWGES